MATHKTSPFFLNKNQRFFLLLDGDNKGMISYTKAAFDTDLKKGCTCKEFKTYIEAEVYFKNQNKNLEKNTSFIKNIEKNCYLIYDGTNNVGEIFLNKEDYKNATCNNKGVKGKKFKTKEEAENFLKEYLEKKNRKFIALIFLGYKNGKDISGKIYTSLSEYTRDLEFIDKETRIIIKKFKNEEEAKTFYNENKRGDKVWLLCKGNDTCKDYSGEIFYNKIEFDKIKGKLEKGWKVKTFPDEITAKKHYKTEIENKKNQTIFVDGSFNFIKNIYGWAFVVYNNLGEEIFFDNGTGNNPNLLNNNSLVPELLASIHALNYIKENNVYNSKIGYDNSLIYTLLNSDISTINKKPIYEKYVNFAKPIVQKYNVSFEKIKSHSGNLGNNRADLLAKLAIKKVDFILSEF